MRDDLRVTTQAGLSVLSMLRGREDHKDRWRPVVRVSRRLVLARPGALLAYPYAAAVHGRARAVVLARQKAPWLRDLRTRVNAARTASRS